MVNYASSLDEIFWFVSWIYDIPLRLYIPLVVLGVILFFTWYFYTFQKMKTPGTLVVYIREAKGLAPKDRGSSDPLVRVQIGDQIRETNVIKANLNPIWNQNIMFKVKKEDEYKKVVVTIWDWDHIKNDTLGEITPISMQYILTRLGHPHPCKNRFCCRGGEWYPIRSHKGHAASGSLFVRFEFKQGEILHGTKCE